MPRHDLLIVIPVLEEAENLDQLLKDLSEHVRDFAVLFSVTVPGAQQEDATLIKVRDYSRRHDHIFYTVNARRGLGRAYIGAFRHALREIDFGRICTMDADGSHQAAVIKELLARAPAFDLVIASRYVPGGKVEEWDQLRKFGSRAGTFFFRLCLSVAVYDSTSGFRIYSRSILEKISRGRFFGKGFFFQLEALLHVLRQKGSFLEVPFHFSKRRRGRSKLRPGDLLEYAALTPRLLGPFLRRKLGLQAKKGAWHVLLFFRVLVIRALSPWCRGYAAPFRLILKITNACHFRCRTCGSWKNTQKVFLGRDKQDVVFKRHGGGILMLTLTGGEPFYDAKYLADTVALAKEQLPWLYYVSINTNGYFCEEIFATLHEILSRHDFLKIFVGLNHLPSERWGAEHCGVADAFDRYRRTRAYLEQIRRTHRGRLAYYKMFTCDSTEDARQLEGASREKDLWLTFAERHDFYDNLAFEGVGRLSGKERLRVVETFLRDNGAAGFIGRRYYKNLLRVLSRGRRDFPCYAGINRLYYDENGDGFICTRGVKKREDLPAPACGQCWTPCEAVFDVVQTLG